MKRAFFENPVSLPDREIGETLLMASYIEDWAGDSKPGCVLVAACVASQEEPQDVRDHRRCEGSA